MRRILFVFAIAFLASCSGKSEAVRLRTGCDGPGGLCARYIQGVDYDGAPVDRASLVVPLTAPVRVAEKPPAFGAVTAVLNLETRQTDVRLVPVRALRVDPQNASQLVIEVDGLLADGAAIDLPDGALKDGGGKNLGPLTVKVHTPYSPFAVALAGITWEPANPALFSEDGVTRPNGARDEGAVRRELEARLRLRPTVADEQVGRLLTQYDDETVKKRIPDNRVRAGLLLLTGTSGEPAIQFVLADTNRRGVPFQPILVRNLSQYGAAAAVFYQPLAGRLQMVVDDETALDSLENIAVVLAHEALHSSLGGGSATEEILAMASDTRVYEELLLFDPAIALVPTSLTREINRLTLALRNSGHFSYPMGGILPRPGVENALQGVRHDPVHSFRDLLFKPDFYGEIPKTGDVGSEVIESYYQRISGTTVSNGKLKFDQSTLKLFDTALDHGFTDHQILAIVDALKLKPVARD